MIPNNFPYKISGNVELFDFFESLTIANGVTDVLIDQIVTAQFKRGWITALGMGIDNPAAFNGTVWQIIVSGAPARYYGNIQDELGPFEDPRDIAPIPIRPGDAIAIRVTNGTAAPRLYAGRLKGFFDYGE